jgi:ribonuclease HII
MLQSCYQTTHTEAGCDEAGRGCLAGPVVAAAVILPPGFTHEVLNDSKQLTAEVRRQLRLEIEKVAIAFSVAFVDEATIDSINILNASFLAMHKALDELPVKPGFLIIDGNRFKSYKKIPHQTIVQGDGKYLSIAAASILAKTYRDEYMEHLHHEFPIYNWYSNKGYGSREHRTAMLAHGQSKYHRKSFVLKEFQLDMFPGQ